MTTNKYETTTIKNEERIRQHDEIIKGMLSHIETANQETRELRDAQNIMKGDIKVLKADIS